MEEELEQIVEFLNDYGRNSHHIINILNGIVPTENITDNERTLIYTILNHQNSTEDIKNIVNRLRKPNYKPRTLLFD